MSYDLPKGIYIKDSQSMKEIEDENVDLIVTSPPYNVGKEYEKGNTFEEWLEMMNNVLKECNRVLKNGGRSCINVASIGRHPYLPLYYYIIDIAFKIGWKMRGTIIWFKRGAGPKSPWGSFGKASDPILRDSHEFILVFQKGSENHGKGNSGISKEEFVEFSRAEWYFQPERAQEVGHPAPFPDELPRRCILFYSNEGDVVLDPFAGSCTTYKVAKLLDRVPIAYEKSNEYIPIILKRLQEPLKIQSKAWNKAKWIETKYPDLAHLSSRELLKIVEKEKVPLTQKSNSRLFLMLQIANYRKKISSLERFGIKIKK